MSYPVIPIMSYPEQKKEGGEWNVQNEKRGQRDIMYKKILN